jgi:L-lactate dehydrogenase (cytochrome)
MTRLISIADYREVARRRLPRIVFDYLEGGALDERTLRRNTSDLESIELQQRILRDVADVDLSTTILGQRLEIPFLIAPMGLLSVFHRDADVLLAQAAGSAGTVFIHSAWSGTPLREVAAVAPGSVWSQLALWPDPRLVDAHLVRAAEAGIEVLVIAGDVSVSSKRERDERNGFSMVARPTLRGVLDAARKPRWVSNFLFGPRITFGDQSIDGRPMSFAQMGEFMEHENERATWADVSDIRSRWDGKLVVKGVMGADDARRARDAGVDAVYVSNHGGRQFDAQPSTVAALPGVVAAAGPGTPVLVDGGVRRGSDAVVTRALGAQACLLGRPLVYGLMAGGQSGAEDVLRLLRDELAVATAFVGSRSFTQVDASALAERRR